MNKYQPYWILASISECKTTSVEDNQSLLHVLGYCMPRDLYIIIYIVTSYGQVVQLQLFNGQLGGKVFETVFKGIYELC